MSHASTILSTSPEWYPLALNPATDRVLFVPLTENEYRSASFLDSRLRIPESTGCWLDWNAITHAGLIPQRSCHFIFHISHVGSTLLARLMGECPLLFSVREPAILRLFAERHPVVGVDAALWELQVYRERLALFLRLWSRTFHPSATAVIKATSYVSEIACELIQSVGHSQIILMTVTPLVFLKTMLTGAMSDIDQQTESRLTRLCRRLRATPWRKQDLSPGERVAMSWLCEMLALKDVADRYSGRTHWVDFDQLLASPVDELARAFQHFRLEVDQEFLEDLVSGPILSRYAKAPEHAFDAGTRSLLLEQAERTQLPEIRKGLEWLRSATRFPLVHQVLEQTAKRYEFPPLKHTVILTE